jgi:two-component system NtrC family sensor kinase
VHVEDLLASEEFPEGRELARTLGYRTVLCVPLLRDGVAIGVIANRRTEVRPFTANRSRTTPPFGALQSFTAALTSWVETRPSPSAARLPR